VPKIRPSGGFYLSCGKRVLDLLLAAAGLLVLSPLFLMVKILSKLASPGPVFYVQDRVGRDGRIFKIVKFRTMQAASDPRSPRITASGDPRVTPWGRVLRSLKIDELPQLWNVLKGDMSLVGPRPEVPLYAKTYTAEQKEVLTVRPGITDPSSIAYRHEEELLGGQPDPELYYRKVVLPHKLALSLDYTRRISLTCDLLLMIKTFCFVFSGRQRYSATIQSPDHG
jgi:lipopolysaccharide/colanic/teichoic acid biosynthesis glycosyltransferase